MDVSIAPASPLPEAATISLTAFMPVPENQRIEALDVVRGFALLGIFLMNIEWFNRPFAAFNEGMPRGLTGLDWLASWGISYFVQGKFWTIFSMLFGMGFAVMLVRAKDAGRHFVRIYLRRILGLAVFGALHYIFIWEGDILFSYAMGALGLLIVLYGRPWPIAIGCVVLIGLGFLPRADAFFRVAGGLTVIGTLALYLRSDKRLRWRGHSMPIGSVVFLSIGALLSVAAIVFWALPHGPTEPRAPLSVAGPAFLLIGWLSWKYHEPAAKRGLRMAVSIYVFAGVMMTLASLISLVMPDPVATLSTSALPTTSGSMPSSSLVKPTEEQSESAARLKRATTLKAERETRIAEQAARKVDEIKTFTTGTYAEAVNWRAREFLEKAANDAGFGVLLVGMFLIGVWFVRSGVMERPGEHLAFFRKLAIYGLPIGVGLGLLSSLIAVSHTPGDMRDGWGVTRGLVTLGNLPACLGYVGLVVTMLYSRGGWSRIRVLAPLGRMALTNYLSQSVICMLFFYGFGLGHWGWSRAPQVAFVAVVYAAQIAFSHWWLARFRYGPAEWLWRGFTYRQTRPMRLPVAAMVAVPAGEGSA